MSGPETLSTLKLPEMQTSDQSLTITPPDLSQFRARLCIMNKREDFTGYGFNLHGGKTDESNDQFVGRVDDNSPSAEAGLLPRDRIVEVNGTNVETLSHKQVVERIKEFTDQVSLLVIDPESDRFYKMNGIPVTTALINGPPEFLLQQLGTAVVEAVESVATQLPPLADFVPNQLDQMQDGVGYSNSGGSTAGANPTAANANVNGDTSMYANSYAFAPVDTKRASLDRRGSGGGPDPGYERLSAIQAVIASSAPPQATAQQAQPEPIDAFTGQPASRLLMVAQSPTTGQFNMNVNGNANAGSNGFNGLDGQTAAEQPATPPAPATYSNGGQTSVTEASRTSLASPGRSMPGGRQSGLLAPPGGRTSGLLGPPQANTYEDYADLNGNVRRSSAVPMDVGDGGALYVNPPVNGQLTNNLNSPSAQAPMLSQPLPANMPRPPPSTNVPRPQKTKRETIKTQGGSFAEKSRQFQQL